MNEVKDCPRCVELAARVIELEGELARMKILRTSMSAVERARLLAERQRKHYEEGKGRDAIAILRTLEQNRTAANAGVADEMVGLS
jgi:hypothetical protein